MNKIYTITKAACGAALLIALAACGNSGKDEASKVKGTGLPKAGVPTTGAPKIAYIEVDSLMTQYEFCKEYTLELTKRSENYQATINSRMQKLQNDVVAFQQKAQQGGYTPEEGQKAQARLQKQQEELQKLQEELTVKFDKEQQKYNQIMRDSIQSFLRDYNKQKGYSIILSKAGDNILYADPAMDITTDVVNGLNKRYKKK